MNNLAWFVTHNLFLTKEQIDELLIDHSSVEVIGCSVPVWVDAKTGKTTEPATEIFCKYAIHNSSEKDVDIELLPKIGYKIFLPQLRNWDPPDLIDFEKISHLTSEERFVFLKERDKWWFNNPKPPSVEDLKNGYLKFEIKKVKQKIVRKEYSAQHVIELSTIKRLEESLTV